MTSGRVFRIWVSTGLLLVIAGFVFRQWPWRGFWYDETVNAYFAEQSWGSIWEWCTQIDNQMPLHFFLLKSWALGAGTSEFALRYFSVMCALLAVAGSMALGRRLGGTPWAGWLAALALALTQSFLYAAFEVRPYALLLALLVWASVMLWDLWARYVVHAHPRDRRFWLLLTGYWLLALALLYTHYTALLALAAHGVFIGMDVLVRRTRHAVIALAQVGAGLALGYVPWVLALAGRDVRAGTAYEDRVKPLRALKTYIAFFTHGQRFVPSDAAPYGWVIVCALLGGLGLWLLIRRWQVIPPPRAGFAFAVSMVAIPLIGLLVMVYAVQAKLSGRHGWMLWVAVAMLLGVGWAVLARYRWLRWPVWVGALLIVWMPATANFHPIYNSYLREAFAYINTHAEAGDVLVLRDGTLFTAAEYYDVALPWVGLPSDKITNVNHALFLGEAVDSLTDLIDTYQAQRVWVLAWQGDVMDPQNLTAGILDYVGEPELLKDTFGFGDVTVTRYRLKTEPETMNTQVHALNLQYRVPGDGPVYRGGYVLGDNHVPRGGKVQIQTWWQRGAVPVDDIRVSVRLYDAGGNFYAPVDGPPVPETLAQDRWLPGELILGQFVVWVPAQMPLGPAEVQFVVYDMDGSFAPFNIPVDTLEIVE